MASCPTDAPFAHDRRDDSYEFHLAPAPCFVRVADEFGPRESIRFLFKDKYDVHCADSVNIGLGYLRDQAPDVIILDIMMPMMSGYEICRQLKSNPETKHIPVLCLTSTHSADVRDKCQKAGAQALLIKPILPKELVAQVRRYLPQPQS